MEHQVDPQHARRIQRASGLFSLAAGMVALGISERLWQLSTCLRVWPVSGCHVFLGVACFRYAFSPLLDAADDDEEEEPMMNDAFGESHRPQRELPSPHDLLCICVLFDDDEHFFWRFRVCGFQISRKLSTH